MNNLNVDVDVDQTLQVGSYGLEMRFNCHVAFRDGTDPSIIIKRPDDTVVVVDAELIDAMSGLVLYVVEEDLFTVAGTYMFQIKQEGEGYRYLTPFFALPIYESIEIPSSSSSSE